jgi:hypothetical protein
VPNEPDAPIRSSTTWQREAAIAASLLAFGLLALPFAIYLVGQRILGEYGEGAGALDLAETIWLDLASLRIPAWLLVLSPYLTIQLVRAVRRIWRRRV